MWSQDTSLNTLSLLGLIVGIGMLVDNAVVVIESIFRYQEMGYNSKESSRIGASDVSTAVIAATLTSTTAIAAASSTLTDTKRETPGSFIVTPIK